MSVSVIEQAKIQAQVLVPLVKALQAELGEARANTLVRKTLGDLYRGFGEEFWKTKNETENKTDLGKAVSSAFKTYARDDALAYDVIAQTEDTFAFDVTRCAYAEFYKALGEPELGLHLDPARGGAQEDPRRGGVVTLRHCERSEAIQNLSTVTVWIASLAMTMWRERRIQVHLPRSKPFSPVG